VLGCGCGLLDGVRGICVKGGGGGCSGPPERVVPPTRKSGRRRRRNQTLEPDCLKIRNHLMKRMIPGGNRRREKKKRAVAYEELRMLKLKKVSHGKKKIIKEDNPISIPEKEPCIHLKSGDGQRRRKRCVLLTAKWTGPSFFSWEKRFDRKLGQGMGRF